MKVKPSKVSKISKTAKLYHAKNGEWVEISGPIPDAVNEVNEEGETYRIISPKGIAWLAAYEADIIVSDEKFGRFWELFSKYMEKCGYISEE